MFWSNSFYLKVSQHIIFCSVMKTKNMVSDLVYTFRLRCFLKAAQPSALLTSFWSSLSKKSAASNSISKRQKVVIIPISISQLPGGQTASSRNQPVTLFGGFGFSAHLVRFGCLPFPTSKDFSGILGIDGFSVFFRLVVIAGYFESICFFVN